MECRHGDDVVSLDVTNCYGKVKDERFEFPIYRRHASRYSPILRKAFLSKHNKSFVIKDTSPSAVGLLIDWLHTQTIGLQVHSVRHTCRDDRPFARPTTREDEARKAQACREETSALVNLWLLAGELQISKLQNYTMTLLLTVARSCALTFGTLYNRVYAKTDVGSPLRAFIAQLCAWSENFREFEDKPDLFPHAMLLDLARIYCQSLPQNVAIGKRNELLRSYHDLMVRDVYYESGKIHTTSSRALLTPQTLQERLARARVLRSGQDEKYNLREALGDRYHKRQELVFLGHGLYIQRGDYQSINQNWLTET